MIVGIIYIVMVIITFFMLTKKKTDQKKEDIDLYCCYKEAYTISTFTALIWFIYLPWLAWYKIKRKR